MPPIDLAAHIAKLRERESLAAPASDNTIIFWGSTDDKSYLPLLKPCVGSASTFVRLEPVDTLTTIKAYCASKHCTRIIATSITLLSKLLHWDKRAAPSLSNYAGSYFSISALKEGGPPIEIVFIAPLKQLATVPYGKFMATRQISKLTTPEKWFKPTFFAGYTLLTASSDASAFSYLSQCFLISIDVETLKQDAQIKCLAYTGFRYTPDGMESKSYELPLDSEYSLALMRKYNWQLKAPKVMQNGKYDISYFTRYSAPVYNYLYDTAHLFHSWYSELPKDLGFLNAFFIREAVYWKDLAETNDLYEYYRYNALDTWGTGNCFLAMLLEVPQFAITNYLLEFPLVFPCHLSEMTGIERDMSTLEAARKEQEALIATSTASLNKILAIPAPQSFNANSPIQMKALLKILGCGDLEKADEKNLEKARYRHPLNSRILGLVTAIRKARKLSSTYLVEGKEFHSQKNTGNRILYALNPHGTDSSRLASRESSFWCGLQIQNIPRGKSVKRTLRADPGFYLAECDLEQAESRDTAYISGDELLIHNVEFSPDFHCANASAFFGMLFEQLYDIATGRKLNIPIRDLAKRVNHGANYNMGAYVLIDTMGEKNIALARQLLKLPRSWTVIEVAEYLLDQFHKTYPNIKQVYYKGVVKEICSSKLLRSKAVHHHWSENNECLESSTREWHRDYEETFKDQGAWTRYCFNKLNELDPSKTKPALNAYVAHPPQSLNAQTLNKAYLTVFRDIAINPEHAPNFKLCAQIHDSILFQYRIGHEYLCDMVLERMEIPITIKAYDGKVRTFVVPAGIKAGTVSKTTGEFKRATYWSETE